IDAFATYEFTELPEQPAFALVPGPAAHWKAIWPSLAVVGEPFRLAIIAEDAWGNPTGEAEQTLAPVPSPPIPGVPPNVAIKRGDGPRVLDNLVADTVGDLDLRLVANGEELARANPLRVVTAATLRRYWGDLHGQSGETIGMGSAESYFRYARDLAFVDIVGHQGNDFQITDAFWAGLNRLTAAFDVPGRFVCLPGYEWSGNTGMGGDRNIFFRREGRPIRRSSPILVEGQTSSRAVYTADELFRALAGEDAVVIAHVGGRYADIKSVHDGRLERSVEVHSTWGTFEWLLHDAFEKGYRVGVVCHSDDHKGRPGATKPGASTFGAVGGLTCYFMPELTRDALFEALRRRRHYGTTGMRLFLDLSGSFAEPVTAFVEDPRLARSEELSVREALMGDIIRPARCRCSLRPKSSARRRSIASMCCWNARGANGASPHRRRSRPPRARAMARRGISRPRPRDGVAGEVDPDRQSLPALRPGEFPQSGTKGAGNLSRHRAELDFGDHRQSRRHRHLARRSAARHAHARHQYRLRRGRCHDACGPYGCLRRRRPRPANQRLSSAGAGLEPTPRRRSRRDVSGRRRPSGLCARDAKRRPPGLVEPDLSHRLTRLLHSLRHLRVRCAWRGRGTPRILGR